MKNYILVGKMAVDALDENNYKALQESLNNGEGDILTYDPTESNSLHHLLQEFTGWEDFQILTPEEYKKIVI